MGRTLRVAVGLTLAMLAFEPSAVSPASAQAAKKAPAKAAPKSESEASAEAMKAYEAGIKAWQGGKAEAAVQSFYEAIGSGKLPQQQMARALYHRGLAQRKLGKPALAISDLQSAIWLKGALSDSERNEAIAARAAAYREAGIADPQAGKVSESANRISEPVRAAAAPPPPPEPAKPVPATAAKVASAPPVSAAPAADWKTAVRGSARSAPAASSPAPSAAPTPAAAAPVTTASAPEPVAAQPAASQSPKSSGTFLSSLFGFVGSENPEAGMPPRRVPPPPRVDEDPDKPKPWGTAQVRPAGASRVAGAMPPATTGSTSPAAAPQAATAGAFRLQVAAAASRAEAEKIAAKLKKEQPKAVAQRSVDIDEAANVYRVRLGPYATANEPRNLCVKLRQSGYDCMVVTP